MDCLAALIGRLVSAAKVRNVREMREALQLLARDKFLSEKISQPSDSLEYSDLCVLFEPVSALLLAIASESDRSSKTTLQKWREDVLFHLERLFGKQHIILSDLFTDVAMRLRDANRFVEALDYCGQALLMRINLLGMFHSKTADNHLFLGKLYHLLKNFDQARIEFFICKGILEKNHSGRSLSLETASCDFSIGVLEVDASNFAAAYHFFYACYCTRQALLGSWDALTIEAKEMVETYRRVNGERHISSLEMRDRIEELQWTSKESSTAEYSVSVFIGSAQETVTYSLTLSQLKSMVKTAVKYSLAREDGDGSMSPPSSPSKISLASPVANSKDYYSYRQYAGKLIGLLLNHEGKWELDEEMSETYSEVAEEGKHRESTPPRRSVHDYDEEKLLPPKVKTCSGHPFVSTSRYSETTSHKKVNEDARLSMAGGHLDEGDEEAEGEEEEGDDDDHEEDGVDGDDDEDEDGTDSSHTPDDPPSISSVASDPPGVREPTRLSSRSRTGNLKRTSSQQHGFTLPFSMGDRIAILAKDLKGVAVEIRVVQGSKTTTAEATTTTEATTTSEATTTTEATTTRAEEASVIAPHSATPQKSSLVQNAAYQPANLSETRRVPPPPPPLPTCWPPATIQFSLEDFILRTANKLNEVGGGTESVVTAPTSAVKVAQLSWEPLESIDETVWAANGTQAVVPWNELFSDFDEVFNLKVPEKNATVKSIPTEAKTKPSVIFAMKDSVETKISLPRQKKIELMLSRIGREFSVTDIAVAVQDLDTDMIDISRQSLIFDNLPTIDEVNLVSELAQKHAGEIGQLQRKLGLAQLYIYEVSKVPDVELRVQFIQEYHRLQDNALLSSKALAETLLRAVREVRTSPKLPFLFSAILQVANSMTAKTHTHNTNSFKLSDLLKLWHAKINSGETLEHYVVKRIFENEAVSDALDLPRDLTFAENARTADLTKMRFDVAKAKDGITVAEKLKERETSPANRAKLDAFIKTAEPQLEECASMLNKADAAFKAMCAFLGEDPSNQTPSTAFGMLCEFSNSLRVYREKRKNAN